MSCTKRHRKNDDFTSYSTEGVGVFSKLTCTPIDLPASYPFRPLTLICKALRVEIFVH